MVLTIPDYLGLHLWGKVLRPKGITQDLFSKQSGLKQTYDLISPPHITWLAVSSVGLVLQIRAVIFSWNHYLPGKGCSLFVPNDPSESWKSMMSHWFYNIFEGAVALLFPFLELSVPGPHRLSPRHVLGIQRSWSAKPCFPTGFPRFSNNRKISHAAERPSAEWTMFHLPAHAETIVFQWFSIVQHGDSWVPRRRPHRFFSWHLPSTLLKALCSQWFSLVSE